MKKTRWVRLPAGRKERTGAALAAGAVAACAGAVTFYLARLILSREPIGRRPPDSPPRE